MSQHDDNMSKPEQLKNEQLKNERFKNELRKDAGPDLDFDRMEAALMARVSAERARRKLRSRVSMGIGALAMAAAAALVIRSGGLHMDSVSLATPGPDQNGASGTPADPGAGALESGSVVSLGASRNAHVLGRGDSLRRGDEVETSRAVFRASGRVVFAVSGSTEAESARVSVTETDRPIVLSLARGVVEAQVDKVTSGEAFAVDVPSSDSTESKSVRIAVHGTHLRVARNGGHVTLDLTEGIVNVGRPPKSGSTYGKLVTAPAHVEFDVASLETSFTMTKDLDKVRIAEDLSPTQAFANGPHEPREPLDPHAIPQGLGAHNVQPVSPSNAKPVPVQGPVIAQQTQAASPSAPKDPGVVQAPVEPRVDARTAISDAIASCAEEKLRNTGELTVTLASTLTLRVGDDGYVQSARFEPPLDPAVQKCAASTIYKVHFTEPAQGGLASVTMPISLKTPSHQ